VRAWIVIAVACIAGTATARDLRRHKSGKAAAAGAPAATSPRPTPPKGSEDTDACWALCSCGSCDRSSGPKTQPLTAVEISNTPLTGAEIVDGFRAVDASVQGCRPANARPEPISVRAAISTEGQVSAVTVQNPSALTTAVPCIESAVKRARFRASPGLRADYVFLFRRIADRAAPDGGVDGQ